MILASLVGTTLIVAVATDPMNDAQTAILSAQQKAQATESLVRSATECLARAVIANPHYGKGPAAQLGDLIVASMPSCATPVRAMIEAYDRYYGKGTGKAFFMGPYLDVLPKAVTDAAKQQSK
jgi:hypothetical protein